MGEGVTKTRVLKSKRSGLATLTAFSLSHRMGEGRGEGLGISFHHFSLTRCDRYFASFKLSDRGSLNSACTGLFVPPPRTIPAQVIHQVHFGCCSSTVNVGGTPTSASAIGLPAATFNRSS